MSLPWRKRLDYRLLRWQARFESSGFNRTAPWVVAALLGVLLLLLALARSRELSQEESLASAMQTVWLIGEGFTPESSLLAHNYLFEQAGFLIYPVALLTMIFPTAITLMTVQSLGLALGVVPLWRLARQVANLRIGSTLAIVMAYGAYSAIHAINLAGFHLEALALPALLGAMAAGVRERWVWYAVFVVLALSARADLGLAVGVLGVTWWIRGHRRVAYLTGVVGLTWTAVAILVVQPAFAGGDFPHVDAFADYGGDNPFSVLWGIVTDPVRFLRELFSEDNFRTLVSLLAPVLFLPVVAPRYLLPAVPLYCLYLVADVPEGTLAEAGQAVPITAFIFVALVFGLAKTGRVVVQKVNVDRRVIGALLFTSTVFFVQDAVTSPYERPWSWGRQDGADEARFEAADLVPDDAVVRASPKMLPMLTERPGLFELSLPNEPNSFDIELVDRAAEGVNWLVFDRDEVSEWETVEVRRFCIRLDDAGWVPVLREAGIQVYTFADIATDRGLRPARFDETSLC